MLPYKSERNTNIIKNDPIDINKTTNRSEQLKLKRGLMAKNKKMTVYNNTDNTENIDLIDENSNHSLPGNSNNLITESSINPETPKIPLITYNEAINYFKNNQTLCHKTYIPRSISTYSNKTECMSQLCSCLVGSLSKELKIQRNFFLNLTQVRYNNEDQIHFRILFTIYYFFKKKNCGKEGEHWQDIGFQSVNPENDLLTVGMLGPLQILYCIDRYPNFTLDLFKFLIPRKCDWLFVVSIFSISKFIIHMTNQGILNYYFSEKNNVEYVMNEVFVGMVFYFKSQIVEYGTKYSLTAQFIAKTIQKIKDSTYTNIDTFLNNHPYIN